MDRDLVERARSGDQEAFADLVHQVSDQLFGVARRILRDPGLAEDVLQNALVTIWRKLPHLREPTASRPGRTGSSSTPAMRTRRATGDGQPPSASSRSTGQTTSTTTDRSPIATSWSRRSADFRSTSGPCSSCITTWACPSWRWPRRSASPRGRPDRDCTTPLARCGPPSRRAGRRSSSRKGDPHERRPKLRTRRRRLAGRGVRPDAAAGGRCRPPGRPNDTTGTGSPDPVEEPHHVESAAPRRGDRDRRGRRRRGRELPASRQSGRASVRRRHGQPTPTRDGESPATPSPIPTRPTPSPVDPIRTGRSTRRASTGSPSRTRPIGTVEPATRAWTYEADGDEAGLSTTTARRPLHARRLAMSGSARGRYRSTPWRCPSWARLAVERRSRRGPRRTVRS